MLIEMGNNICIENILFLRKKYHISRRGLAKLIGIREYMLRNMEEGRIPTVFTREQLMRISPLFNLSLDKLVNQQIF